MIGSTSPDELSVVLENAVSSGHLAENPAQVYAKLHASGERHCHVPSWGAQVFFK